MPLHARLTEKWKQAANNVILCAALATAVASIAVGYSKIRESQVSLEIKLAGVESRLVRVEDKLDRAYGWQQEGVDVK